MNAVHFMNFQVSRSNIVELKLDRKKKLSNIVELNCLYCRTELDSNIVNGDFSFSL
jgi:hypothetical protein